MKFDVAIATHKAFEMPEDKIYRPLQVGAAINSTELPYSKDNTGDHISDKNLNFCELTALYWLWKNSTATYKGLAHYRRHFSNKKTVNMFQKGDFKDVLDGERLTQLTEQHAIILPQKRKYYIETIGNHYTNTHYAEDLKVTKAVLQDLSPEYDAAFEEVLSRKSAHMFNMFIMKDEYFNNYCEWLFSVLFELEKRLDISTYSPFHQRVFGRISEILLDVWLTKNQYEYVEIPVMFMEEQNWNEKITKFLKAKFLKKKY